jgi:hypothetical protein
MKQKTETASEEVEAALAVSVQLLRPARVFRDTVFTSRTLVLPDGRTLSVVAGRVTACGDDQYNFLKAHPDMEPLPE